MRRVMTVIGLEVYALLLAGYQMLQGVRTDEAKYLMNIPYPHPPLMRWVLSLTDGWAYQEAFWRIVFASLVIQAVWIVWSMAGRIRPLLSRDHRLALGGLWLLSAAVILQAGTVMMAVLTGLHTLVLLWMWDHRASDRDAAQRGRAGISALMGFWWLAMLFTAYQAILLWPLVLWMVWRDTRSVRDVLVFVCLPVVVLLLYTLTNPLAVAAALIMGGQRAVSVAGTLQEFGWIWVTAGSGVCSVIGAYGLLRSRAWPVIASCVLVVLYTFFSPWDYYAMLLTPFLVWGAARVLYRLHLQHLHLLLVLQIIGTAWIILVSPPSPRSLAQVVLQQVDQLAASGDVLIHGSFGHEWQYENGVIGGQWSVVRERQVLRYREDLSQDAGAVVCLTACEGVPAGMRPELVERMTVYVRPR